MYVIGKNRQAYSRDRGIQNPAHELPTLLDFHKADLRQLDPIAFDTDATALVARPVRLAVAAL